MGSRKPGVDDTLGALAGELDSALVFKQSLCVGQATFPTLEGLLFDSPPESDHAEPLRPARLRFLPHA